MVAPGSAPLAGSGYFGTAASLNGVANSGLMASINSADIITKHKNLHLLIHTQVEKANGREELQYLEQKRALETAQTLKQSIAKERTEAEFEQREIAIAEECSDQIRANTTEIEQKNAAVTADSQTRQQMFEQRYLQEQAASNWRQTGTPLSMTIQANQSNSSEAQEVQRKETAIKGVLDEVLVEATKNLKAIREARLAAVKEYAESQYQVTHEQIAYEFDVQIKQVEAARDNSKLKREYEVARQKSAIDQQAYDQLTAAGQQLLAKKALELR